MIIVGWPGASGRAGTGVGVAAVGHDDGLGPGPVGEDGNPDADGADGQGGRGGLTGDPPPSGPDETRPDSLEYAGGWFDGLRGRAGE